MSSLIRPEIKLVRAFMPILVTINFDDDSIKTERASMRQHFPIISLWERSRAANSVVSGPIWAKFEFIRDFMHVLVTSKYKKDRIKTTEKRWRHHFPYNKSMRAFCCHGNQRFDPICPRTLCSLSSTRMMLP